MRNLVVAALLLVAAPAAARAEVGIGLFVGEPAGLDLKFSVGRKSALDLLVGWDTFRDGRAGYGHLTYLYTPFVGVGSSVLVPLRIGIGGAFYGNEDDVNVGVRAPLELGLRFTDTPIELYGEIALLLTFLDENNSRDDIHAQGGLGLRFYF
ncbi:MAG: hypothetical protein SFX73_12865 [Kofleriaceae bacterium]|nr:hypothetical protein [Kofleriaceae bacterium]